MDTSKQIIQSLSKLQEEFNLRKSLFLNVVYRNIDILVNNSVNWFEGNVPKEFTEVINSLLHLSVVYLDQTEGYFENIVDSKYEEFSPEEMINYIYEDYKKIIDIHKIDITIMQPGLINTSKPIFKDAFINLLFSVTPYVNSNSEINTIISTNNSNVNIEIHFNELDSSLPEIHKMLKQFYSIKKNGEYLIRIGFYNSFENFKRIGAILKFSNHTANSIIINISFPSTQFLDTVDDIRKNYIQKTDIENKGNIIISLEDRIAEMILTENLSDFGYETKIVKLETLYSISDFHLYKSIIVDLDKIQIIYGRLEHFIEKYSSQIKIVIILKGDEVVKVNYENVHFIKMPFEIETIVNWLDT